MDRIRCCAIAWSLLCLLLLVDFGLTQSCGKRKVVNFLVVNGTKAKDGYWPWHSVIFYAEDQRFSYRCGGTILGQNTVLTAAQCVRWSNRIIEPNRFLVRVGQNRLRVASNRAQEHEAFELIVHPKYSVNSIQHDIALIKLATDITYTDYIQPICLWNRGEDLYAIVGSWGTVIGFGIDENDNPSDTLREATIPVVSHITCIATNEDSFASQLTSNMFCAGSRDGISECNGYSGGGLFFKYNDVWFIRGIVSFTKFRKGSNICDANQYTVFTDVAKYLEWIEPYIEQDDQPTELVVASRLAQSCGKSKATNSLITHGTEAKDGSWPWHAVLYHSNGRSRSYACGGTILDQHTVLTAARCLMTSDGIIERKHLVVQVGRDRLWVASNRVQEHEAFELIVHPKYSVNSIQHDIALIKLATDITYTDYIQPICLWNRGEDLNAIVGSWGTVIGFGIDETDDVSDTLREATISVVSHIKCIESSREVFANQLTSNMFCAGNRDGIGACNGDSGGGLFFNYNNAWFIRGIVSFTKPRQDVPICDTKEYTVFTDVAKYLEWIKQPKRVVSHSSSAQSCGKRKVTNILISNGNATEDGYWPWHVALFYSNRRSLKYACGGTILDENTILTAAHCLKTSNGIMALERLVVHVGRSRLWVSDRNVQEREALRLIVHPAYNPSSNQHDIGLIKLATDISYTNYIQPICLWNRDDDQNAIVGSWGTVIGFGNDESGKLSDTLREATMPVVSHIACLESNRDAFASQLFSEMFCAGYGDGVGAANGDSGGGFFFKYNDVYFIRGVVSFSNQRQDAAISDTKLYTVFTDVAMYLEWIKQNMRRTGNQPMG